MTIRLLPIVSACSIALFSSAFSTADSVHNHSVDHPNQSQDLLASQRVTIASAIAEAYVRYPNLPKGSLEALAYVSSRWSHAQPEHHAHEGHHERPQPVGVMGLYDHGSHFIPTLQQAADALGVAAEELKVDPRLNVLATAALLDQLSRMRGLDNPSIIEIAPVLAHLSGIPAEKTGSRVDRFAQNSHLYDIYATLQRGESDHGIEVPQLNINLQSIFNAEELNQLTAPVVDIHLDNDSIDFHLEGDSQNQSNVESDSRAGSSVRVKPKTRPTFEAFLQSTDYGPALWQASPYHGSRTASVSAVTVHTTQGSYAGTISWFKNNPYSVSAHYVIRSSDGQLTQMVREYRRANHVGSHNSYTLGIEHEGYVSNPAWYTTSMYNASANLVKHFCARYSINCKKTYNGASSSGVKVLSTSIKIKGHQHFSGQTHTDPGIHWDWPRYYALINGSSSPNDIMLDNFESGEGHFNRTPAYSGSTTGISTSSTAQRTTSLKKNGSYSEQIKLLDNTSSSANWAVRFLSGSGNPSNNTALSKAGGRIGFWVYTGASGIQVAVSVDDSDGTERSDKKSISANRWTYVEWWLDDSSQWNAWAGGNGVLGSTVSLDAIWFFRNQTSYTVYIYIDDVQYRFEG